MLLISGLVLVWANLSGPAQSLPGFTLNGENWTYDPGDGGALIGGILSKPSGSGQFPGVIISHGAGGNAVGYTLPNAHIMTNWGLVGIGCNYTHTNTTTPDNSGWCPENSRRASACLNILRSLSYVETNRLAAYGHSMGAFVTGGFCGLVTNQILVAAIASGGTTGVTNIGFASPARQEVQGIVAPFLMLHGTADTTVYPTQSLNLQLILNSNGVPNNRILLDGAGHDIEHERSNEVYTAVHDWFSQWGLFSPTNPPAQTNPPTANSSRPRGIFVLDSAQGTLINGVSMRDANIRTNSNLTGYVLRAAWQTLEPSREVYDFTLVSNAVARLGPLGQKLSLILVPQDPPYIVTNAGVTTWTDQDQSGNPLTRAVPWDPFLLQQRRKFLAALAGCQVGGVALSNHPVLQVIDPYLAGGFTGIRDPNTVQLRNMAGYTRSNLLKAVQTELRLLTTNFPGKFVQIGFWKVLDGENGSYSNLECWEYIRRQLLAEFDGVTKPRVGFFMENLAASRPGPGQEPMTGYPVTSFGTALYLSQTNTWTAFQALTSWKQPFTGPTQVTNGTPADGMAYAFASYGATYFEMYVSDFDYAPNLGQWMDWHQRLTAAAPQLQISDGPNGKVSLNWDRASPVTTLESSTNAAGGFLSGAVLTNSLAWTNPALMATPRLFYRIKQTE